MIRAHVYRLYPTAAQAERLGQWVGAVRLAYNLALEQRRQFWRPGRRFDFVTQGREVTALRAAVDWMQDVPREPLDQAIRDLDGAFRSWWAGRTAAPTFRQRGRNDSLRFPSPDAFRIERRSRRAGILHLPKMGAVRLRHDAAVNGEIRQATVSRRAGRWFVAVLCSTPDPVAQACGEPVGIDRGITTFAALSTGEMIGPLNAGRRRTKALARAQRRLARKTRGSQNYKKQRNRVARLHMRVADARKDFLHKASTKIANSHGIVVLEDLKIGNMTRSASGRGVRQKAGLNRSILDQGWGQFKTLLAYKLEERGGQLITVNPAYTSQTCSACGVIDADSRRQKVFACRSCGHMADADHNASLNILAAGLAVTACGGERSLRPRRSRNLKEYSA